MQAVSMITASYKTALRLHSIGLSKRSYGWIQGFQDKYRCKKLYIPYKKKWMKKEVCNELSEVQKSCNKAQAAQSIKVEHGIGGMKRYQIISHRLTLRSTTIINCIICVRAALWNIVLI
jgi:hypothetical protein